MTYRRILNKIKKPNKRLAQRVLQCLVVAVRPLPVEELAEVIAVDFDDVEGIPMLKPDWRWEEQELALLSAWSSLIAIVGKTALQNATERGYGEVVKLLREHGAK
jgi:hypothetical protein